MGRHRASASPSSRCNPEIDRMEPRRKGWKTGKLKRRPPARSSRGRRLRRSMTRSASVEITPTARTVTGSFSASVGPSIVRVREAACVNTCGATCTPTFQDPNDGKVNPRKLCEQIDADRDVTRARAPFAARASFRPRNQTASLWTKLRNCQTAVDLLVSVAQGWICSDSHRKISRLVTKKKREKTERRVSEAAASPADRPDASSHRARAPTSPREVIAHHRREPGTLEPGRLTARRTPPARETPAKRTENAGYRADTGDTTPRVTGKGAMRAGREARRGSGEMPRHGR